MELYQNLLFTGIILSALLSLIFLLRKRNNRGNIYFSAYLLALSAFLLLSMASTRRVDVEAWAVIFYSNLTFLLLLLSGPLLLLYFSAATGFADERRGLLYLMPSALMLVYTAAQLIQNLLSPVSSLEDYLFPSRLLFTASYTYMLFCFFKTLFMLKAYRRSLKTYYSDFNRKRLLWFSALICFVIFISLTDIVSRIIESANPEFQYNYQVIDIIEIAFIITVSFFALLQPEIINPPGERYGKNRLTEGETARLLSRIESYMENQKPYLDDISLPDLAAATGMSVHKPFPDHQQGTELIIFTPSSINTGWRKLSGLCIPGIMISCPFWPLSLEAGFNSKSVFYSFFKEHTGKTPSAYREKIKNI